jgi:hypothetical protein
MWEAVRWWWPPGAAEAGRPGSWPPLKATTPLAVAHSLQQQQQRGARPNCCFNMQSLHAAGLQV